MSKLTGKSIVDTVLGIQNLIQLDPKRADVYRMLLEQLKTEIDAALNEASDYPPGLVNGQEIHRVIDPGGVAGPWLSSVTAARHAAHRLSGDRGKRFRLETFVHTPHGIMTYRRSAKAFLEQVPSERKNFISE